MTDENRVAPRRRARRLVSYGLAGLAATGLHYGVMALLLSTGLAAAAATSVGALAGAALHYVLSSRFVFGAKHSPRSARTFLLVATLGFGVNALVVWSGHAWLGLSLPWVQLTATATVFALTYTLNAKITFRPRRTPAASVISVPEPGSATPAWASGLLLACFLLLGVRLLSLPLYPLCDRTESRYAEVAREMVERDDWVSPHLHGAPFWAKPPLATWCEAAGIGLMGPTEFAVRFPAWLAVVLTLAVLWRIGLIVGGPRLGRGSFIIFCTAPMTLFMAGGVMTDPFLVLGTTLALWGIVRIASMSVAQWLAHGTSGSATFTVVAGLTIAALAKGPIGLAFGAAPVLGLLLSAEGRRRFTIFPYMNVVLGFILCAVPWFVLAESRTPGFLEYFIIGEHVQRFLDPTWQGDLYGGTHPKPHGIVWLYFGLALLPWIPAAVRAVRVAGFRALKAPLLAEPLWGVLAMSAAVPLVLFTFAGSLLPTYVYPAIPAASILLARGIARTAGRSPLVAGSRAKIPLTMAALAVPLLLLVVLLPDSIWVHSSQRDLLRGVTKAHVVYGRSTDTLYSADFYSDGHAASVMGPDDVLWETVRAEPLDSVIVTKKGDCSRIPTDLRQRLHLEREIDGYYQLWSLAPPQKRTAPLAPTPSRSER